MIHALDAGRCGPAALAAVLPFIPMPSAPHEILIDLFRERPGSALELLRAALGDEFPAGPAVIAESTFSQIAPTEYLADLVIVFGLVLRQLARPVGIMASVAVSPGPAATSTPATGTVAPTPFSSPTSSPSSPLTSLPARSPSHQP